MKLSNIKTPREGIHKQNNKQDDHENDFFNSIVQFFDFKVQLR